MKKTDTTKRTQENAKALPRKSATLPMTYHSITVDKAGKTLDFWYFLISFIMSEN